MRTNVLEILNAPWAIIPEKLLEIREIYARWARGEGADLAAVEARIGKPLANEQQGYTIVDGVAVLPLTGVIAKRMNLFTQISGGTSTQIAMRDFVAAVNDPAVHSIVLLVDSPGGAVDGVEEFSDVIFSARGKKPVTALIDGVGASAAYWLASAASKVYVTGNTVATGSIGVVGTHVDYSQRDAKEGVKVTEITAGKYKRIASEHEPLSKEGRASLQEMVDTLYSVFVDAVARNRGASAESVAGTEGKLFIGKQAINAGLVDGISTLGILVARLNDAHGLAPASVTTPQVKPAEKSIRQVFAEDAAKVRRQPWGSVTPPQQSPKPAPAATVDAPIDAQELAHEAADLQHECAKFGIAVTTSDAVGHVMARRAGTLNQEQIARAAQIEQARLAGRGIAVSTAEAVRRVLSDRKQIQALI